MPAKKYIHLRVTQDQMRRKTGSNGNFAGPLPLCGDGSFHVQVDYRPSHVTCEECQKILATKPRYLQ